MKSLSLSLFKVFAASHVIAAVCLLWPVTQAQSGPLNGLTQNAPPQVKPLAPESEVIRLRAGELPEVTLTSSVLFRILASEISSQRGYIVPAGTTMLELARETSDPRLARRALEFY